MDVEQARERFAEARVARLATVRTSGAPHLVPVTFAVVDDRTVVTAVDHKPKRSADLVRLANIEAEPQVSLLADHYEEDWTRLWWVRVDGHARVVRSGPERAAAIRALVDRYAQYHSREPEGPAVVIQVDRWTGWAW